MLTGLIFFKKENGKEVLLKEEYNKDETVLMKLFLSLKVSANEGVKIFNKEKEMVKGLRPSKLRPILSI